MLDLARLRAYPFPDLEHADTARDTMLYALGIGVGFDPLDARQLRFAFEKNLQAMPTIAVIPGYPGERPATEMWIKGSIAQFQGRSAERGTVVLRHGVAELAA
jgi:hypothetical protein